MIRWSALLSMALLMLPVSGCNKGRGAEGNPDQPDLPEQQFTAFAEAGLVSDAAINNNSTRAEFIGEVGHKTHMPNLIKWGETGGIKQNADGSYTIVDESKGIPAWVLPKHLGTATNAKVYLTEDYHGIVTFPYDKIGLDNNKFRYVAAITQGTDSWLNGGAKKQEAGAWVSNFNHTAVLDFFILWTKCVPELTLANGRGQYKIGNKDWRPLDISNRSISWPMLAYPADEDYKPDPSKFWCEVTHDPARGTRSTGQVYFKLFGNMINIRIANNSGEEAYDASYSTTNNGPDVKKRPHLMIESNGMLFAPAKFRFEPGQNGGYDIKVNSKENKIKFRVDNLTYTKRGEEQNFPIWFRPVNPTTDGKPFYLKVTWMIYSAHENKWYKETRTLKPSTTMDPVTGTPFDAFDGHYYTFDLAFNASYGLEFGTEKFVEIVNDVPAFD